MADYRYTFPNRPATNPKAIVQGSHYRFSVLTDRLLRYEWSEDGGFEDRVSTFALFRWFDAPHYRVVESKNALEIITDHFHLKYDKREFSSSGLSVTVGKDVWHYDGKSYGDLGGTARTLDGAYGRVDLEPGVLSRKAYAVLDDSKSMLFEDGWIATRRPGRIDGYVFAYNGDHKAAIRDFYRISGSQPVLPRWTLGNWWSRYHEYSASEYLELMDHFKREGIPLNVGVVDMDWHKVNLPPGYGSGWTGYSWNRDLFPDPEGFLKELHRRNLKVTLNDHPADGIRAFEDLYEAVAKALNRDPSKGEPIDFDCTDRKFLDAYFDVLKLALEKQGVDFWWIDWQQGNRTKIPGVDPLWVLNHYHYLTSKRSLQTLQRPLTFSRYAGAGSHRYPIGFSGDQQTTWEGLEFQPEFTATASNIGYGWWSHDIGGHWGGVRSNQLNVRWVQLGCFSPILRLHSNKSPWNSREPWNYEKEASKTIKDFLILRHRLIPFLYTMNIRASYENEPLIQPMYWNHNDAAEAYTVPTQYYFGPDLIVAPITSPTSPTTLLGGVRAWLPPGRRYVDLLHPHHLVYDGGRYMHLHRDLSHIPVLAPEGTILPLDSSAKLANGSPRPTDITLLLVVGKDAHFELVEEPEHDLDLSGDEERPALSSYVRTPITWNQAEGLLTIGPEWNNGSGRAKWRQWHVKLVGHTGSDVAAAVPGFRVTRDPDEGCTTVALGNVHRWSPEEGFEIALGRDLQLDVVDVEARVFEVLHRCEMLYELKDPVWDAVRGSSEGDVKARVEKLHGLKVDAALKNAVMEIWAADGRSKGSAKGHEIWADAKGVAVESLEQVLKEYVIV
ncbi:glycoside hydrolase family 31 protein [Parathielavia appendiculata]|uniref:alpha-glucosidase n=1 Tax=Parathielavia appendiculata TaxID=2587402 RepID=A0AAN6TRB7_9PEZI|nr:glycoside hydrolase family 31 protein [Parathielavia appendiculata]